MADFKLKTDSYQFDELATRYAQFLSPALEIIIDGTKIMRDTEIAISSVTVDSSADSRADTFSFRIVNAFDLVKREFKWIDTYFELGKSVEIQMGYKDQLETVMVGLITSISYSFEEIPAFTVTGMDMSFLMMTSNKPESWDQKKYSDVVKAIAGKYGLTAKVDDTETELVTQTKVEVSDFALVSELARNTNFEFFVRGKNLYFRKPLQDVTPALTLFFGLTLSDFTAQADLYNQISSYTVRGMKSKVQPEVIEGKAQSSDIQKLGTNTRTGADILNTIGSYFDKGESNRKLDSVEHGKEIAKAKLNAASMQFITGSGTSIGLPELQAGRCIKLEGLGKKMSQVFFVSSVTHSIDEGSGYTTRFQVRGNAI
ncbi:phage late control D family protein [Paenibacillus allorhizosphaerae]|uniref:Phage late control D family protein n=1 Tax=Paenibacillus allorhizosphaerae TaxID=2849866 RepID=A0ABN7TJU8_9BACL|nr:hypothetical protein [Paenibacillus allorhizosphaerae]CAG7640767.1 hypothetical protein PAECIP111802_02682 [Paenibacillus allorhizosphaerae]